MMVFKKINEPLKVVLISLLVFVSGIFLDKSIAILFNKLRSPLDSLLITISSISSKYAILAILGVILLKKKNLFAAWILSFSANLGIAHFVKTLVAKPRPFQLLEFKDIANESGFSFPSGHAIVYFAAYPFLAQLFPKHKPVILTVIVFLSLLRVFLNVHYLSDIAASAIIAIPVSYAIINIIDKFFKKKSFVKISKA